MIPDYDDYYSLTGYARRFVRNPMREIDGWLSQKSTIAAIADWEMRNGNEHFRSDQIPFLFERVEKDEVVTIEDLVAMTACQGIALDGEEVIADIDIFNDFVAFLTARGVKV